MAERTDISWCDATWSPWYGCTQVSMGPQGACEGCYARQISETRFGRVVFGGPGRGEGTRDVRAESAWKQPLRWNRNPALLIGEARAAAGEKPLVFPSMCDPFDNHPALVEPRRRFFDLMRATPNLTWLPLTKRPGNIVKLFVEAHGGVLAPGYKPADYWPPNAAIGCTVVTQEEADRDVPKLLAAKAALNPAFAFLSMEPLLGPVRLTETAKDGSGGNALYSRRNPRLDWVITGGETDQGPHKARPSHPDWFREVRDQCAGAGVAFHFKQWGQWTPGENAGPIRGPQIGSYLEADGVWSQTRFTRQAAEELTWDDEPDVWRVGAKAAGHLLDGVIHDARPEVRHG